MIEHSEIFTRLNNLKTRLQWLTYFQRFFDFILFYFGFSSFFGGNPITLFGTVFTKGEGLLLTLMVAAITFSITALKQDPRRVGRILITILDGQLSEKEIMIIRQFQKYAR
ncbi:hypothetical protein ACE83Q_06500 [Dellaglioa sp. P0083]|uniref:hypothetical protein n=1 Tax=Dellaglioa kimchii TaxID=3344667 RepID=UPI0038D3E284